MPFISWLKQKAKANYELRQFKKGVKAEAQQVKKEVYRKQYRKRVLREAKKEGAELAKPRKSFLADFGGASGGSSVEDISALLLGTPSRKRVSTKKKRR